QKYDGLSGSFFVGAPHTGHVFGQRNLVSDPVRADVSTRTTCGMISPAFSTTTMSPTRMPLRSISSALCRLALLTVVPARRTGGAKWPTRGNFPVPPTRTPPPARRGRPCSAATLFAPAPPRDFLL